MRRWNLVGRADELSRLLAAATAPGDRGLIYSGAAGVGKSRLLQEAVDAVPTDHHAVHVAAANIASSGLPFGGLAQVLPAQPPAGLSPAGLLRWAVDTLHEDAVGRPVVLAVDDAHLLDAPSAALVHLLVREGATLLGTLRTGEPVPAPISALWTEGLVQHAELVPLSVDESRDLLAELLDGPAETGSAQRLIGLAAGYPLMLRELALAAQEGGEMTRTYDVWRWTGRLPLGHSLAEMVDTRIGPVTSGVRDVLELVAFGEPLGLPLLLRAGQPTAVERAEERGLIRVDEDGRRREVRFTHPLYAEVVRRRCPVSRAHRLRSRLAALIEDTGARRDGDLLRTAVWRLDSGSAVDAERLLEAAGQAFARFDLDLTERLATAAVNAGAGAEAAELLATSLLFTERPEQAEVALDGIEGAADLRATVAFWGLEKAEAADGLAETAPSADRPRRSALEALMRLHLAELMPARRLASAVLEEPATDPAAGAMAQCAMALLAALGGEPDRSAELIAEISGDRHDLVRAAPALQYALPVTVGTRVALALDLAGIDEVVATEFAALSRAGGFGFGTGWTALLQSHGAWLRGQTGVALRAAEEACAALAASRHYDGTAHAARAYAAALRGDTDLATESMAIADSVGDTARLFYPWWARARAWVTACTGDVPVAVHMLSDLLVRLRVDGLAGHELLALHDLVRLGRADLAVGPMAGLLATVPGGRAAPLLQRHARAAAEASADGLFAVAREFAGHGYLLYAAEAAAGAVRLFRAARDPQALAASTLLADTLGRCDTVNTPALREIQPSLTHRERQVAELAAVGTRSRDIADRLYLSPRTVENHLQRVYAKLGVNGRTALAPALRSLPQ
ncbi:MAG TPA: LuxR C-terminal-related transcriptional regulator [Actinoplanes sp.]